MFGLRSMWDGRHQETSICLFLLASLCEAAQSALRTQLPGVHEQPSLRDAKDGGDCGKLGCAHTGEDVEERWCGTTKNRHGKVKPVPPTLPN